MKKIYLLVIVAFAANLSLKAQETTKTDTIRFRFGNYRTLIFGDRDSILAEESRAGGEKKAKPSAHWCGLDVGLNKIAEEGGDVTLSRKLRNWDNEPIRSLSLSLNVLQLPIPLTADKHTLVLSTGLGISYRSFSFDKDNIDMVDVNDSTSLIENPEGRRYSKRKFRISYLTVPLLLGFNTSDVEENNFHVSVGVIGSVKLGSLYKQKYEENGDERKIKTRGDFNLSPYLVDATVRVGFKNLTLFGQYGLTNLFKDQGGPELIPITIGVQLIPFQ